VDERWVLNASPLILLSKTGYEWLFFELAEEVVVPTEVAKEVIIAQGGSLVGRVGKLWRENERVHALMMP